MWDKGTTNAAQDTFLSYRVPHFCFGPGTGFAFGQNHKARNAAGQ
jgi:hypothetical protein